MTDHNAMLNWPHVSDRYAPGFYIGSEDENGEHLPDASGWPYSIYRKSIAIGVSDAVLCNGIQSFDDAIEIVGLITPNTKEVIYANHLFTQEQGQ